MNTSQVTAMSTVKPAWLPARAALPRPARCGNRAPLSSTMLALAGLTLASAVLSGMSGNAAAVVTLDVASAGSPVLVDLDPSIWTDYSTNCEAAGGTGDCDTGAGQPNFDQEHLLFSWGELGNSNSVMEVTYTGSSPFLLEEIRFDTDETAADAALGPGPDSNPFGLGYEPYQGLGTMVAYERNFVGTMVPEAQGGLGVHYVTDQRMDIHILDSGRNRLKSMTDLVVAAPQDQADVMDSSTDFFSGADVLNPLPGEGFTQYAFDRTYNLASLDATIEEDYIFQFVFYEADGRYNNSEDVPFFERGGPDAYYGDFFVTITPSATDDPSLAVAPAAGLDFGTVRAGDTTAMLTLTATNDGDPDTILTGVTFADPLTGSNADALRASAAPTDVDLANPGGVSEEAIRSYWAAPLTAGETTPIAVAANQQVTSTNGIVNEQNRPINAVVKGPVLGVSQDASADPATPADWLPYGSEILLGSYEVGDADLISDLILGNIFSDVDGDFTMLTFYNIGTDPDDPAWSFDIIDDPTLSDDKLQAQETYSGPLRIAFSTDDPSPAFWTATLTFTTDQNAPFNQGIGQSNEFSFVLRVNNAALAPAPSALVLLALGLVALTVSRCRRG